MRCNARSRRLIQRRHAARLLHLYVRRTARRDRCRKSHTPVALLIRGSTSYFSQFSETFCCTTRTYHAKRDPKSPPPPVKPKPPLAAAALNKPYGPLTGPPSRKEPRCSACCSGCGLRLCAGFQSVCFGFGFVFDILFRNRNRVRALLPPASVAISPVPWIRSPAHSGSAPGSRAAEHCSPGSLPWHRRRLRRPSFGHVRQ